MSDDDKLLNPDFGQFVGEDEAADEVPEDAIRGKEGMPGQYGYGLDKRTMTPKGGPPPRVLTPEDGIPSRKRSGQYRP